MIKKSYFLHHQLKESFEDWIIYHLDLKTLHDDQMSLVCASDYAWRLEEMGLGFITWSSARLPTFFQCVLSASAWRSEEH
jgi:hypothetical protein